jgi:3-dehydroquinate synthase class II
VEGLKYPETIETLLKQVNYNQIVVALVLKEQIPDSGLTEEVVRQGNQVIIRTKAWQVGPGNYVLEDYTWPYQIIAINKDGTWAQEIHFILERGAEGPVADLKHFVP